MLNKMLNKHFLKFNVIVESAVMEVYSFSVNETACKFLQIQKYETFILALFWCRGWTFLPYTSLDVVTILTRNVCEVHYCANCCVFL